MAGWNVYDKTKFRIIMNAFEQIVNHLENKKSFVLEAGAGAGKTYTLVQTLKYIIDNYSEELENNLQKIICITYTNIAKNEIIRRIENNSIVRVLTIHEFLWESIKTFQKQLKIEVCILNELRYAEDVNKEKDSKYYPNLNERIQNIKSINYDDSAFRDFEKGLLHHNDIIELASKMFENYTMLTTIVAQKYPFIFVDEYQDTAKEVIISLIDYLLERNYSNLLLGFYGDSHQKIYDVGIGDLESYYLFDYNKKLELVKKEENYRSSRNIINLLNNFRKNIQQIPQKNLDGNVKFIYCNYLPLRKTRVNKNGKTIFDENVTDYESRIEPLKNENYDNIIKNLNSKDWNFKGNNHDKILVLANSRVAKRANFWRLFRVFDIRYGRSKRTKDQLLDRNNPLVRYFTGYIDKKTSQERNTGIEHLIHFWERKNYNEVIRFLKKSGNIYDDNFTHQTKVKINEILNILVEKRQTKSIREVFEFILQKNILRIPEAIIKFKDRINIDINTIEDIKEKERIEIDKLLYESFMDLPYQEIINFFNHTQNNTVFSTKHGTKGDEFRNVLTIIDDTEWKSEYNFEKFFDNTDETINRKIRTRNLFYVECSRAKENLIVLALSEMNDLALQNIKSWFGEENVLSIDNFLHQ